MKLNGNIFAKLTLNSLWAGILIGLAGCASLYVTSLTNKVFGSVTFAFGLLMIVVFDQCLFTGAIAKIIDNNKASTYILPISFVVNAIGCLLVALLIKATTKVDIITELATATVNAKLAQSTLAILSSSILCGLCITLASKGYLYSQDKKLSPTLSLILPIAVFVLLGFDHSVANMFYLFACDVTFTWKMVELTLVAIVGNIIGGSAIPLTRLITHKVTK